MSGNGKKPVHTLYWPTLCPALNLHGVIRFNANGATPFVIINSDRFFFLGPLPEEKGITERVSKNTVDVDAEIVCLGAFQLLMSLRGLSPFLSRSSENEFIKSNFIGSPGGFVSCSFVGIPGFSFSDIGSGVGDRKETSWRCASI